jgi:hypothetical protein
MPSTTRTTPAANAGPKQVSNLTAALVLMALVALFGACNDSEAATDVEPEGPPAEPALVMPDLRGLSHRDADDVLRDAGIDWARGYGFGDDHTVFHDLSYLHRETRWDGWKVWSTVPAAGHELAVGDVITAFSLLEDEWAFFDRHERMPRSGWRLHEELSVWGDEDPLHDVETLSEFRFVPQLTPRSATPKPDWADPPSSGLPRRLDPSIEPRRERQLRNRLKEAGEWEQFVTTSPRPGQRLRPGQAIVVLVRPRPDSYPEVYGLPDPYEMDWDVYVDSDDDDDDGNIPGWLCPTRFC